MALKKQELQDMFDYLSQGLPESVKSQILKRTGRGGMSAARDYISANCLLSEFRKVHPELDSLESVQSENDLWSALHPATKFRLRCYTPMLATQIASLKPAEQEKLFTSPDWWFTSKENGIRAWVILYQGTLKIYSRNYSDKDCSLLEYSSNIDQHVNPDFNGILAIDVEVKFEPGADIRPDLEELGLTTDSPLEAMTALLHTYPEEAVKIQQRYKTKYGHDLVVFRLIAPLYFNGVNYLKRTLGDGMQVYNECGKFARSLGLNVKPIKRCNGTKEEKINFLNSIIEASGEGIVAHNSKSPYVTSENRSKEGYIKIKRTVGTNGNLSAGMDDTIDGWVSGFKVGSNGTSNEGLISAFQVSCYVNDSGRIYEHVVAVVPNVAREVQIAATVDGPTGLYPQEITLSNGSTKIISLNPKFDGMVVEVAGQALSSKSMRLEHPRLIRYRMGEKLPEDCIYTKEFFESQKSNNLYKTY